MGWAEFGVIFEPHKLIQPRTTALMLWARSPRVLLLRLPNRQLRIVCRTSFVASGLMAGRKPARTSPPLRVYRRCPLAVPNPVPRRDCA